MNRDDGSGLKRTISTGCGRKAPDFIGCSFHPWVFIGLSIPETRKEQELMGERKDKLLSKAKEAVREKMEKLEHVAFEVMKTATAKAKEEGLVS